MESRDFPTEEEQFKVYKEVLERLGSKPVVIRTLDIGGNIELEYLDFSNEGKWGRNVWRNG